MLSKPVLRSSSGVTHHIQQDANGQTQGDETEGDDVAGDRRQKEDTARQYNRGQDCEKRAGQEQ